MMAKVVDFIVANGLFTYIMSWLKKEDDCFTNPIIRVSDEVNAHITAYSDPDYQTLTKISYHVKGHSVFIKMYDYR